VFVCVCVWGGVNEDLVQSQLVQDAIPKRTLVDTVIKLRVLRKGETF
jgi:hypothetical protein